MKLEEFGLPSGYNVTWQSPGVIPGAQTTSIPRIPMTLAEACPIPTSIKAKESLNKIYNRLAEIEHDAHVSYHELGFWDREVGKQSLAMNKFGLLLNKISEAKQALDEHVDAHVRKVLPKEIKALTETDEKGVTIA